MEKDCNLVADVLLLLAKCLLEVIRNKKPRRCQHCGMSFEDITKTTRAGCGNCYNVFYGQLRSVLAASHGSSWHLGKRPR